MDDADSHNTKPKAYAWRWVILTISGFVIATHSSSSISFSAVTFPVKRYYNVSAMTVDSTSSVFYATAVILAIPSSFIMSRCGLQISLLIPAACNAIGTSIRIGGLAQNQFIFIEVGQIIISLGVSLVLVIMAQVAAAWFPANERTFATSCGIVFNVLGLGLGFLASMCMVPNIDDLKEIGDGIRNMLVIQTVVSFAGFFMVIVLFRDSPPTAPSMSEYLKPELTKEEHDYQFWNAILALLRNRNYILITIAYSLNYIAAYSSATLLSQIVDEEFSAESLTLNETNSGWIGFSAYFASIPSSLVVSYILDKNKRFKKIACITMLLASASMFFFAVTVHYHAPISVVGLSFVLVMMLATPYSAAGLDHLSEIGYPIPEGCSCAVPMMIANCLSFAVIYLMQIAIDVGKKDYFSYALFGMEIIAFLLSFVAEEPCSRTVTDSIRSK